MLTKKIDSRGLACPQPVINTKKALEELEHKGLEHFLVVSLVDNETAAWNVKRHAQRKGYPSEIEKKGEALLQVTIKKTGSKQISSAALEKDPAIKGFVEEEMVLLVTSSTLGEGSNELGQVLMRSFFYTLTENETLPAKIFFLNSGVYLTTTGSAILEELETLLHKGVLIYSCGTCLDYFHLKEKLQTGEVTNMYNIVEEASKAQRCVSI